MAQWSVQEPRSTWTSDSGYAAALEQFRRAYPAFDNTAHLDQLRSCDYARLDRHGQTYLDYTGAGLYAESQLRRHMELLTEGVFGNPHSANPTSLAATRLVEQARARVFEFFHASPDEYVVIFTPNASGALKLVGESYPFDRQGDYVLTYDNHNSVNGIREFARSRGAQVTYLPVELPELRVDEEKLLAALDTPQRGGHRLLAFPAQSNFSGVQHPLAWIELARTRGWDSLVDCAAFAPSNRLDVGRWQPDFVPLSFYKIFGYPSGVGCLLARRAALAKLRRPWFAGGTITIASVQGEGWHYLGEGEAAFEDGTVNYLSLPAVDIGLQHITEIGIDAIHTRVTCLTGWLLQSMTGLRHGNGAPLARIYGPTDLNRRGGTVAFNLLDPAGETLDYRSVEALASQASISLRTGCFCNPGAGEVAHGVSRDAMGQCFAGSTPCSFEQFFAIVQRATRRSPSTIRVSLGLASNFADVVRFIAFVGSFRDVGTGELLKTVRKPVRHELAPDAA